MEKEEKELRDTLMELYLEKDMSMKEIAKELGTNYTSIWLLFKKYGIQKRTIKKALKLCWKRRRKIWIRDDLGRFAKENA